MPSEEDDAPATKADFRRLEEKFDRRDVTLFGEDGRGGLVADVNRTKALTATVGWLMGGVVLPVVVGIILFLITHPT